MNIYEKHGYRDRRDYLISLAEDYNVDLETVFEISSVLGSNEDFDGLVSELEDIEDFN